MKRINKLWLFSLLAILIAGGMAFWAGYATNKAQKEELQAQLKDLTDKEKRSVVERRISAQMEEIALEQKKISDQQREEAVQQTRIADEMRQRAEVERRNALEAEQSALESERRAVDASRLAENQRAVAEERRAEAEYSRSVADTLSYLALARSLASVASTQENIGNHELALLLAYTSYLYTDRYHGDLYNPVFYQALSQISKRNQSWKVHNGSIMKQLWEGNSDSKFITISTYGEIIEHDFENERLTSRMLFSDKNYDIRDIIQFSNGISYAISRTGHIILLRPNGTYVVQPITGAVHPFRIFQQDNMNLLVVAENGLFVIAQGNLQLLNTVLFEAPIYIAGGAKEDELFLFNNTDIVTIVSGKDLNISHKKLPFKERVFSYSFLKELNVHIYGTTDGVVILVDKSGRTTRLVGHRSRVSRVSLLYRLTRNMNSTSNLFLTTSYDGTVKAWDINKEKIEPMDVMATDGWLMSTSTDKSGNYLWTGDQNGYLTRTLITVSEMAKYIKESLTRDFTQEEWAYYIGNNIPYESFIGK